MNDMVKVTWSADGEGVALPEAYRLNADQVWISREGDRIVLVPVLPDDAIDEDTGLTIGRLRKLIQQGLDSGPDEPLDMEAIKRKARARFAAERSVL